MASSLPSLGLVLTLVLAASGCNQAAAAEALAKATGKPAEPGHAEAAHAAAAPAAAAPAHTDSHGPGAGSGSEKFAVPFAWESSPTEPLSVARAFLGEALRDNRTYSNQGVKVFAQYRDEQKPRATVVTCADSRVHTGAFDATPENDVFLIKNIGNQIANAEGSVEYGVAHFGTPVLLVIGHTGCGAVKAALGDLSKQSKAVRAELAPMKLPKPAASKSKDEKDENAVWAEAVIANVHQQVKHAVRTFGERVQQGNLTVVGAVYDFRNDLGNGTGKLTIVDVNGNDEPERMKAFVAALGGGSGSAGRAPSSAHAYSPGGAWSPRDLVTAVAELEARQKKAKAAGH